MTTVAEALRQISQHNPTRARGLHAQRFWRLSCDPQPLDGLSVDDRHALLAARALNRSHYLPYCTVCGQEATFDPTLRIWRHNVEELADHIAEHTSNPDSHIDPPGGLSYVVWSGTHPIAWVGNDGTVTIPTLTGAPRLVLRHQQQVRAALLG